MSSLKFDLIVDTLASGSVLTSGVCLQCPDIFSDRQFLIDFVVLPLSQINVIFGMDWLSFNHVLLNCFEKFVVFPEFGVSEGDMFLPANQVEASLREDAHVYMILASMSAETKTPVSDIPLAKVFPEVFEDVYGLPPEREVEFSVDLGPVLDLYP
ncbi:uncharacterized protein LOC114369845 [Glycine soja]|uniref:uncharacterized protein n=1 Tax=Glycine max TaxID=3847 RepID=UPI0007193734|nr:uncharacterized protein LOC106797194 [Glycine max]XP_028182910.1 uncharacterized protein LOC114369845 [Glycine soja]|eukprot:XP_014626797.1 uncharacterized protein LOC106797194 [Glycine max]